MLTLFVNSFGDVRGFDFGSSRDAVVFLGGLVGHPNPSGVGGGVLRRFVGEVFRGVVQREAVSQFPIHAIVSLSPEQRDVLYSPTSPPVNTTWETLPPLVVCADPTIDNITPPTIIDDEESLWIIDTSTDEKLIETLMRWGAIRCEWHPTS